MRVNPESSTLQARTFLSNASQLSGKSLNPSNSSSDIVAVLVGGCQNYDPFLGALTLLGAVL